MKIATYSTCLLLIALITNITQAEDSKTIESKNDVEKKLKQKNEAIKKMSVEESTKDFFNAAGKGDFATIWAHFPERYQKDIDGLIQGFTGKMDQQLWEKGFSIVAKVSKLLKEKKKFIVNLPHLKNSDTKPTEKNLQKIADFLELIVKSDLKDLDKLKKIKLDLFIEKNFPKLQSQIEALSRSSKVMRDNTYKKMQVFVNAKIEVVEENEKTATLKVTLDGKTEVNKFNKIDGKWFPEDLSKDWDKNIVEAKKGLQGLEKKIADSKPMALAGMTMIDSVLDQLLKADTQEEFNKTVDGISKLFGGP